jgi:hypothetical protein
MMIRARWRPPFDPFRTFDPACEIEFPARLDFPDGAYETCACRRPIKMSPICQLQMTLAGGFPGVSGMTVRLMSDRELTRLEALRDVDQKRLGGGAAAGARAPSVFRLLKAYRTEGVTGLIGLPAGR